MTSQDETFEPLNIVIKEGIITFNGLPLTEVLSRNDSQEILQLKSLGEKLASITLTPQDNFSPFNITRDRKMVGGVPMDNGTKLGHGSNINMVLSPNGNTTFIGNISTLKKNIIPFRNGPTECLPLLDETGNILGYIPIYDVSE